MKLRFHPAALTELRKSADYYLIRSPQASQRFATAVDHALNAVLADPTRYAKAGKHERACSLEKFPFQIIYRLLDGVIYVVAVAHAKRRPGYWKHRK